MKKALPTQDKLYPLFANLRGRRVLVVGGGEVAARKVAALLGAGALIVVGAPHLNPELSALADDRRIEYRQGAFDEAWLDGVWLVVAASDDIDVNRRVAAGAEVRRLFANVVDNAALSSFHVPAVVDRAPLQIAISSGGAAPMLARRVREHLEVVLDHGLGPLAQLLERARDAIRARLRDMRARRAFYDRLLDGDLLRLLRAGRDNDAARALGDELKKAPATRRGNVALVGAGPGDPGLLTLRALRALNEADVLLYDRLVDARILDLARRDVERIDVGKQAGAERVTQARIHALLLEHAQAGRRVVRLKGGDPFIFGRGGEELEFLRAHAIDYEVVPGITAALACAAYAGVPLTHRDHAQSVQFLTAHTRESLEGLDVSPARARSGQTLAIYMGASRLGALQRKLLDGGHAPGTPVAVVENGSRPDQRVIVATLGDLDGLAERHDLRSPALLVVGEVAALAAPLAWFGSAPIIDTATVENAPGQRRANDKRTAENSRAA